MSNIYDRKNTLVSFFILTFLITWGLGAFAIFFPTQFQTLLAI